MPYTVIATTIFSKSFKKFPRNIQLEIDNQVSNICSDPTLGEELVGTLEGWRKIRVMQDLRLVYEVLEAENTIRLILVGHRRNIYDELERYRKMIG